MVSQNLSQVPRRIMKFAICICLVGFITAQQPPRSEIYRLRAEMKANSLKAWINETYRDLEVVALEAARSVEYKAKKFNKLARTLESYMIYTEKNINRTLESLKEELMKEEGNNEEIDFAHCGSIIEEQRGLVNKVKSDVTRCFEKERADWNAMERSILDISDEALSNMGDIMEEVNDCSKVEYVDDIDKVFDCIESAQDKSSEIIYNRVPQMKEQIKTIIRYELPTGTNPCLENRPMRAAQKQVFQAVKIVKKCLANPTLEHSTKIDIETRQTPDEAANSSS